MIKKYIAPPDGHSDMRLGSRHEYIALSRRIDCVIVWLSLLLLVTNAQSCCLSGNFFEAALIDCINNKFVAEQSRVAVRWDQPIPEAPQMEKNPSRLRFVLLFLSATQPSCWQRQWRPQLRKTLEKHLTQNNNLLSPPAACIENCHVLFSGQYPRHWGTFSHNSRPQDKVRYRWVLHTNQTKEYIFSLDL